MTSLAVTQEAIEDALIARFSGITIPVGGVDTDVAVFMEEPAVEENPERVYPSVAMMYLGEGPDFGVYESDIDEQEEEVGYDNSEEVHERIMRQNPQPQILLYSVDIWNKVRAQESRELLFRVFRQKVRTRDYITVQNLDGEDVDLWLFWDGNIVPNHERYPDEVIYHYTLTVSIHAYMAMADISETRNEKVAMGLLWRVFLREEGEPDPGKLDITVRIDENGIENV